MDSHNGVDTRKWDCYHQSSFNVDTNREDLVRVVWESPHGRRLPVVKEQPPVSRSRRFREEDRGPKILELQKDTNGSWSPSSTKGFNETIESREKSEKSQDVVGKLVREYESLTRTL